VYLILLYSTGSPFTHLPLQAENLSHIAE
jgi:hypothetical protein